jgi:DNA invertase Pin-like site-specific DNA recombinase
MYGCRPFSTPRGSRRLCWTDRRPAERLALGARSLKAGLHPFSDHRAFEFGGHAHHLKHRLAGRRGRVELLLVQHEVDPEGVGPTGLPRRRKTSKFCNISLDAENPTDYCRIYHAAKESDTMDLGYARVSTREQDLTGQVAELQAAGCAKIYSEKASGARGDRAELARVIKRLQPGDVLVVTRLDRLARSTRDLLNVLEAVKQAGAGFRSLKDAWCDTTTPHGVLMLTILGGLAEFERTLIKARTGEGRERAQARGVRFGRPLKLSPHQRREAIERLDAGDAVVDVARTFGVYRLRAEGVQ